MSSWLSAVSLEKPRCGTASLLLVGRADNLGFVEAECLCAGVRAHVPSLAYDTVPVHPSEWPAVSQELRRKFGLQQLPLLAELAVLTHEGRLVGGLEDLHGFVASRYGPGLPIQLPRESFPKIATQNVEEIQLGRTTLAQKESLQTSMRQKCDHMEADLSSASKNAALLVSLDGIKKMRLPQLASAMALLVPHLKRIVADGAALVPAAAAADPSEPLDWVASVRSVRLAPDQCTEAVTASDALLQQFVKASAASRPKKRGPQSWTDAASSATRGEICAVLESLKLSEVLRLAGPELLLACQELRAASIYPELAASMDQIETALGSASSVLAVLAAMHKATGPLALSVVAACQETLERAATTLAATAGQLPARIAEEKQALAERTASLVREQASVQAILSSLK